jgi:hypothetical protein
MAFNDDDDEKRDLWKNRPVYSPAVRIGNWNEDHFMDEEKAKLTIYKKDHCQLLVQKTKAMFKNLLRQVPLAQEASYVVYGSVYQLKASELPNKLVPETGYKATHGLYLSGLLNEKEIEHSQHLAHNCALTASPEKSPCVRNTFVFVGCDGQADGQTIYYGDDVYIRIYESADYPLYVQCENATSETFGVKLHLRLTQSPDMYCRFKIFHWEPLLRYETTGTGFAPNTRVIIQHSASGKNLAAEYTTWIPTFFGAECVVSCHTLKDTHRMETAENIWKIVCEQKPDMNLYVRAAKGEEIPNDLLN